jgi:hypothetical protein
VLLPELKKLSAEQAKLFIGVKGQGSVSGGVYLPLAAVTPEVAHVLAANPSPVNLTLVGDGPLPDSILRTLLRSQLRISLRDLEELTPGQIRIVTEALASTSPPRVFEFPKLRLPNLRTLDSPLLAETLGKVTQFHFPGVREISPEAAAALGVLPERYIGLRQLKVPNGSLSFPSLEELSPEVARPLLQKRWTSISLPALEEVSLKTVRGLARQTAMLTLGIPALPPELAKELAEYEGILEFQGLGELPAESAAALASFPGAYLVLSGPAAEKLSPEAAASLAEIPGTLQIPLRELDSVPLAQRFARQSRWTLFNLETVSREAAPALSRYKPFLNLRALTVLDSPEMAKRLVEGTTPGSSITLPALSNLSPEAAEILGAGSKSIYLGLTVLDSPAVATALSKSRQGVNLPRLRAATPEVIAILKESTSIETPSLESLYVLSESRDRPY